MAFTEKPPPPPEPDKPLVDPKTGLITDAWRQWLVRFLEWSKRMAAAIP